VTTRFKDYKWFVWIYIIHTIVILNNHTSSFRRFLCFTSQQCETTQSLVYSHTDCHSLASTDCKVYAHTRLRDSICSVVLCVAASFAANNHCASIPIDWFTLESTCIIIFNYSVRFPYWSTRNLTALLVVALTTLYVRLIIYILHFHLQFSIWRGRGLKTHF